MRGCVAVRDVRQWCGGSGAGVVNPRGIQLNWSGAEVAAAADGFVHWKWCNVYYGNDRENFVKSVRHKCPHGGPPLGRSQDQAEGVGRLRTMFSLTSLLLGGQILGRSQRSQRSQRSPLIKKGVRDQ